MPKIRLCDVGSLRDPGTVLTVANQELNFPGSMLFYPSPQDITRSRYQTVEIINGQNDKADFDINGATEKTATVAPGIYKWWNLMGSLASDMNTQAGVGNISAIYDKATMKPTVSRGSGTLNLRTSNGSNKRRSIWYTLGFSGASNKTGSLSYPADYAVKSTFGPFTVIAGENTIPFDIGAGALSAVCANAGYNILSVLGEIKYQMDIATGLANSDPHYNLTLLKYVLAMGSGTFNLNFATTANSIAPRLGYNNANKTGALSYNADTIRIMTEWFALYNMGAAKQLSWLAILNHNLTANATLKLQGNNADNWAAPPLNQVIPITTKIIIFPADPSYAWYRLYVEDRANPAGYIQMGISDGGTYRQFSRDFSFGCVLGPVTETDIDPTDAGTIYANIRGNRQVFTLPYRLLNDTDKGIAESVFQAHVNARPLLLCLDPADPTNQSYWVRIVDKDWRMANQMNKWDRVVNFEEFL